MTPSFPIVELIDRYAISMVKMQRTMANEAEYNFYNSQLENYSLDLIAEDLEKLITIHNEIWELEKELKSGTEHKLSLEEIGRRAIAIRNKNNERVKIKNKIAKILDCPVREIKREHLSE